jgi:hypothetical protein
LSSIQLLLDTGQPGWDNGQVRIEAGDRRALAIEDLVALGEQVEGLDIRAAGTDSVTIGIGDDSWSTTVAAVDSLSLAGVRRLTDEDRLIVGDKLSREAREHLTAAGGSWFDRRVGAHLVHGNRTFDVRFAGENPSDRAGAPAPFRGDGPIRGRAGVSYAAALLLTPDDPPTMRAVAREVGMSPQSVSNAAKLLAEHGLVVDGRAVLPDLFWAIADGWRPVSTSGVATAPEPDTPRLTTNVDDLDEPGWALGGDQAARALGAPVFTTDDRPTYWVPSQTEARRAERTLGATDASTRVATILVPPTPLVVTRRVAHAPWPLAHPLFVALDLARDQGRGREILDQWHPEGVDRVWS